jgi:hypothetical protein
MVEHPTGAQRKAQPVQHPNMKNSYPRPHLDAIALVAQTFW